MRAFSHQQSQSKGEASGEFSPSRANGFERRNEQSLAAPSRDNQTVTSPLIQEVLRSSGEPLGHEMRSFMEPRFGHDFSRVRVHTDTAAAESAREVGARAYTVGSHVVFGRSASAQVHDRRLLAHELAHVVQQREASGNLSSISNFTTAPKHAEQSADHAASAVAKGGSAPPQPGQPIQLAREEDDKLVCKEHPELCPAPAPGQRPVAPAPPPNVPKAPERKDETPSPAPPEQKSTPKPRSPVGTNGMFKDNNKPTKELSLWNYVVYQDHVRLGNRRVDDSGSGVVIGSWPWLLNNPGDLTGDLNAREEKKEKPDDKTVYRKDERVWGRPVSRGEKPKNLTPSEGSKGLDAGNTAIEGVAARTDLAIFTTMERGRRGLKDWIQKYYTNMTLAVAVDTHLGSVASHMKNVDDPKAYAARLQQYLSEKGFPANYVTSTVCKDIKDEAWDDVLTAFAYVEGVYNRRAVAGEKGKFTYIENKGIIYRCDGRDPIDVDPAYKILPRVQNMPETTPPEVKKLLGCE